MAAAANTAQGRVSPPTATGALPPAAEEIRARMERKLAARNHTVAKRNVFAAIYARLVQEVDPAMLNDPRTDEKAAWKAICSHRYRTRDPAERQTQTLMKNAARRWLVGMRDAHFNTPADQQRRREAQERAERERVEARQEMAREARARLAASIFPPPRPTLVFGARLNPTEIAQMLRGVSPEVLNTVMQDVSPAMVGRIFELLGLGESGEMCPVCMDPKRNWSKFTRKCAHSYCLDCAITWAKTNMRPDGLGCPFCVKEGVPKSQCVADPCTMFTIATRRETPSLIPFSAAQIPLLQRAVDAEFPSSSAGVATRCPECSTVSAYGNDIIRRCHNPLCAVEFCLRCNFVLAPTEPHSRHASGDCIKVAEEADALIKGEGLSPCSKCGTQIWHAVGHACHAVKCPLCSYKFCHACGVPYDQASPMCRCPIFCRDDFVCKCAKSCPECTFKTCEHCNGTCPTCMARTRAQKPPHTQKKSKE